MDRSVRIRGIASQVGEMQAHLEAIDAQDAPAANQLEANAFGSLARCCLDFVQYIADTQGIDLFHGEGDLLDEKIERFTRGIAKQAATQEG